MSPSLIFTYNIRRSLFQQGVKTFYRPHQLKFANRKVTILPVVNNLGDSIEFRAKELSRLLSKALIENNHKKCDLVSFSLSGLDARFAISQLGLHQRVKSLITVGTPHRGSKLAWLAERQIFSDKKSEPIARLLGVGLRPFWQVAPQNMIHFNKAITNVPSIKYFSIGAEKMPNSMVPELRETGNYLRNRLEQNFVYENDGVLGHDQCIWGEHLVNFQADHSQLLGLTPFEELSMMISLIEQATDSVKKVEA